FLGHQVFVLQPALVAGVCLETILQTEQVTFGLARILCRRRAELLQYLNAARQRLELPGILHLAQERELVHGEQAAGATRMPRDEDQIAFLYTRWRPLQIVIDLGGLPVLIRPEERNV